MSFSLRPARIESVEAVDDFVDAMASVRAGEIDIVSVPIHEDDVTPIGIYGRYATGGVVTVKKVNEVSNGLFVDLLSRLESRPPRYRPPLFHPTTTRKRDLGPHIDPTLKRKVKSFDDVPFAIHYTAWGSGVVRAAGLEGPDEAILSLRTPLFPLGRLNYAARRASDAVRPEFENVASVARITQGCLLGFLPNGVELENGAVVSQTMHDFVTDEGKTRVCIIKGIS